MYRRRFAAFAGAIGLLGALFLSGVAARADTAISDATFTTMVDTYVAQALSGQALCLTVPMTNDGTCPSSTQSSTDQNNIEVCVEHDTMVDETCSIEQHNMTGHNIAIVVEIYTQNQNTTQTASISQTNDSGPNLAAIVQIANQSIQSAFTQVAHQNATISQTGNTPMTDTGRNLGILHQSSNQFGQSAAPDPQEQDSFEYGTIDQTSTGVSRIIADQSQSQKLKGTGSQTQTIDPRCCSAQGSNLSDDFTIKQSTDQSGNQNAHQVANSYGMCTSSGQCTITQSASDNTDSFGPSTTTCTPGVPCNSTVSCGNVEGSFCGRLT